MLTAVLLSKFEKSSYTIHGPLSYKLEDKMKLLKNQLFSIQVSTRKKKINLGILYQPNALPKPSNSPAVAAMLVVS
ncbi:hypothetical protein BH18THE1_BH18THE1_10600 [soil metagenome]